MLRITSAIQGSLSCVIAILDLSASSICTVVLPASYLRVRAFQPLAGLEFVQKPGRIRRSNLDSIDPHFVTGMDFRFHNRNRLSFRGNESLIVIEEREREAGNFARI